MIERLEQRLVAATDIAMSIDFAGDVDIARVEWPGGQIGIRLKPTDPSLDLRGELYDANGTLLISQNPVSRRGVGGKGYLAAGVYYVHMIGASGTGGVTAILDGPMAWSVQP